MPSAAKPPIHAFVPVVVAGPSGESRQRAGSWLAEWLGFEPEPMSHEDVARALKAGRVLGVVFLVPGPGDLQPILDEVVPAWRSADRALPIVLAGDDLPGPAVALAFRRGITDVLFTGSAPPDSAPLLSWIERRGARARGQLFEDRPDVPRMLGSSPLMMTVARLVERVAPSDATILILGESGTGKELIARALHALSPRRRGPFIAINCAAIPETLLENELFGHEKGAYTGANATAIGKVEAAEKGTLFLDEIGEMPLQLQSKILRLLQDHTYDRIGGTKTRKADVRIVTATNRELKAEVAAKRFREDLYYRLSVVPVTLPALRERPEDIPVIARAILERLARDLGRPALRLSDGAMARLLAYRWPGNVRELENELERAAVLATGDEIAPSDLELRSRVDDPERAAFTRFVPLDQPLDWTVQQAARHAERLRIATALEEAGGDLEQAAAALGISREDMQRRMTAGS